MLGTEDQPKPPQNRRGWIILAILLVIVLALPGAFIVARYGFSAARSVGLLPYPEFSDSVGCSWRGTVIAWVDSDGDGSLNDGERLLPGVMSHVRSAPDGKVDLASASTDSKGESELLLNAYYCPEKIEVRAEVPDGMKITTPTSFVVDAYGNRRYSFAFNYLPGVPTITPPPAAPTCKTYTGFGASRSHRLTDLVVAPDGSAWASTYGMGVTHIDPETDSWTSYSTSDDLSSENVTEVTIAPDGVVYFTTDGGITRYVDGQWSAPIIPGPPSVHWYWHMDIAPDGMLWISNQRTLWRVDPVTLRNVETYSLTASDHEDDPGWETSPPTPLFAGPDGTIWLPTQHGSVLRLFPPGPSRAEPAWVRYETLGQNEGGPYQTPLRSVNGISAAPDGSLWMSDYAGLAHYGPERGQWAHWDSVPGISSGMNIILGVAAAPDGSIWISGSRSQPTVYHFFPASAANPTDTWLTYDTRDGLPELDASGFSSEPVSAIALAPDGAVWFGTSHAATRCVFP